MLHYYNNTSKWVWACWTGMGPFGLLIYFLFSNLRDAYILALSILSFDGTHRSVYLDHVAPCSPVSQLLHSNGADALRPGTMRFLCSIFSSAESLVGESESQELPLWPWSLTSGITQSYCPPAVTFSHVSYICLLFLYSVTHFLSVLYQLWLLQPSKG